MCEEATMFDRVRRKARKEHRCYECRQAIRVGDEYERHDGLWDGSWEHFKLCLGCVKVMDDTFDRVPGFCFIYGELHETIAEAMEGAA